MAETANNPVPVEDEDQLQEETLSERFMDWVRTELVWYAGSFSFHLLALSILLLLPNFGGEGNQGDAPVIESKADEVEKKEPEKFDKVDIGEIEETPPAELDVDPTLEKPAQAAQDAEYNDDSKVFEHKGGGTLNGTKDMLGGGGGSMAFGPGPKIAGAAGIGSGLGTGKDYGSGGSGSGFGGRGSGSRKAMLASGGGTKHTERAVTAALVWLANHQDYDGHWSLQDYTHKCTDKSCTGPGREKADTGATAMGVLPFLAAGQTHKSKGAYKDHVLKAVQWLIAHQTSRRRPGQGCAREMYEHGLATIALSEAYGLSGDHQVGQAAQGAVNYILNAQNTADGGWRYHPKDPGDTSVVGWQLMALKSAHMAGLNTGGASGSTDSAFLGTSKWLDSVAVHDGTEYSYQPGVGPVNTMTSVGLLCRQYLGAKRDNPMLIGGMDYLMKNLPDEGMPNVYYWYYATQVMHNMSGYEWDTWNRKMRDLLVHTQVRDVNHCANGSWAPQKDTWCDYGGRVMKTALSCLTLEIYYRYLPLFKADATGGEGGGGGAAVAAKGADAKADKGTDAKADKGADAKADDKADKGADAKAAKGADDKADKASKADKAEKPDKKAADKKPADKKAAAKSAKKTGDASEK